MGFQGYMGDAGGRLKNKPYNKGTFVWATQCIIYYGHPNHTARPSGGQTVMIFDCHRRYPRAYVHRHKCHTRPEGFGQEGPSELYMLLEEVNHLVKGVKSDEESTFIVTTPSQKEVKYRRNKIYTEHPHATADNHFSGEHVLDHAGRKGYGLTMTNRRDRCPDGLKPFLHTDKIAPGAPAKRARVMRYENPILAVKQVKDTTLADGTPVKPYTKTLVSFQSTGPTNISGVNNLPSLQLFVTEKTRGKGEYKRVWGIEKRQGPAAVPRHILGS